RTVAVVTTAQRLGLHRPCVLHPAEVVDDVNVEIAVVPAAGPEETVEPLDLVHKFGHVMRSRQGLKEADRSLHAVAALEDDLPKLAVVHPLGELLHRPAV